MSSITTPALSATQNFTYDSVNRLSTASEGTGPAWTRVFNYTNGNMYVTPTANLSSFTPQSSAWFDTNNRLVSVGTPAIGYESGGSGNLATLGGYTFTYDAEGRQATSSIGGATTTYAYDGLGQRVMKQTGASTTIYAYDASGNLAAEDDSASVASPCGTPTCYLTVDHLGSTRLVTDGSGNVTARYDYLPFGEEIQTGIGGRTTAMGYSSTPDAFNLKFTGQVRDPETLSDYFNARYYRPDQGRFNSPDPDSAGVDPTNTQTWNGYAYVASNPMMYVDPSGLSSITCTFCSNGGSGDSSNSSPDLGSWQGGVFGGPIPLGYLGIGGWGSQPTAQQWLAWTNASQQLSGFAQSNSQSTLPSGQMSAFGQSFVREMGRRQPTLERTANTLGALTAGVLTLPAVIPAATGAAGAMATGAARAVGYYYAVAGGTGMVLGRYPDYVNGARAIGASVFNVPPSLYAVLNAMGRSWTANQQFLDTSLRRGQQVYLSNAPLGQEGSAFAQELQYMLGKGFGPNSWIMLHVPFK